MMRNSILIAALLATFWLPHPSSAQICNPSNTSGCPANWLGRHASTTPTAIPGTGYTINGVTTASIDEFWGVEYNHSVCPIAMPPVNGNQSGCDIAWVMPHEAPSNPNNYEIIYCMHGGGGSLGGVQADGCWGDGTPIQESILKVQRYLGTPNAVGGKGIVLALVNYRLTATNGVPGTNSFPAQWQDAKCAVWHVLANPTIFPGNKSLIGMYGASWGATMVRWASATPDNLYPPSCDSPAPSTPPQFRVVESWNPMAWMYPFGNSGWDNSIQALRNAMMQELNCTSEGACEASCALLNCDPIANTVSANMATYLNVQEMHQYGAADTLIIPKWGSGASQGGNLYGTATAYAALSPPLHPYLELLPNCIHVCDTTSDNSPSETDAFNFLIMTAQTTSGGLGGTGMGRF
jgi:hypothetical protein